MAQLDQQIQRYAQLIIDHGVNLQRGQALVINAELAHRAFVHRLVETAFAAGARFVDVDWNDPQIARIRAQKSPREHLVYVPDYLVTRSQERLAADYAYISLTGREEPDVFEDVDSAAMQAMETARRQKLKTWYAGTMANRLAWCVCAVATPAWARKVFPNADPTEAEARLWEAILAAARADGETPGEAWEAHRQKLQRVVRFLEENAIRSLHFLDETPGSDGKPRTDLTIGLTDRPRWVSGGDEKTQAGLPFAPNIPTEEAFTTPHNQRTQGYVRTSMPFFALEQQVENAYFRFENGELVEFAAERGEPVLEQFFSSPGTRRLGEVALVDVTSPIYQSGLLFYNTLFDENAASHIAFGKAYPMGVKGGTAMSEEELAVLGVNDSPLHQDIMIGTDTMRLTGTRADGSKVIIMENGRYTKEVINT